MHWRYNGIMHTQHTHAHHCIHLTRALSTGDLMCTQSFTTFSLGPQAPQRFCHGA